MNPEMIHNSRGGGEALSLEKSYLQHLSVLLEGILAECPNDIPSCDLSFLLELTSMRHGTELIAILML